MSSNRLVTVMYLLLLVIHAVLLGVSIGQELPTTSPKVFLLSCIAIVLLLISILLFVFGVISISEDKKNKGYVVSLTSVSVLLFLGVFLLVYYFPLPGNFVSFSVGTGLYFIYLLDEISLYDKEGGVLLHLWKKFQKDEEKKEEGEVVKENEVETPIEKEVKDVQC